uniref:Uncharacterized protein n=1 Tax=Tetraodon nigroviridis TaxID=99883 RepID=H3CNF2_TETNG
MRTLTTTLKGRSMTWRGPAQSRAAATCPPSTPVRRACRPSPRRARPRWSGWRACWRSRPLSTSTWPGCARRRTKATLKMGWRWMRRPWSRASLRTQTWSTEAVGGPALLVEVGRGSEAGPSARPALLLLCPSSVRLLSVFGALLSCYCSVSLEAGGVPIPDPVLATKTCFVRN